MNTDFYLKPIKRTYPLLLRDMEVHYSQPKGFVGRNICYAVYSGWDYYGAIVGGSTPTHLPGRKTKFPLNNIVNNLFFHIEKKNGKYPCRNFAEKVLERWRHTIQEDWEEKYGDRVLLFETLVELPRTGECYKRDEWEEVGLTKGFTCKRIGGIGTDSWSGQRVWDTENLRPKRVFRRFP